MTWLIFALGAVLTLAGAISIASGIPYVRIEWGWTEVIAGATALSGGIVTLALGAVLLRLSALQRTLHAGFGLPASIEPEEQTRAASEHPDLDAQAVQAVAEPLDPATFGWRAAAPSGEQVAASANAPDPPAAPAESRTIEPYVTPAPLDTGADQAAETAPFVEAEAPQRAPWTAKLRARFRRAEKPVPAGPVAEAGPSFEFPPTSDPAAADSGTAPSLDLPGHAPGSSGLSVDDRASPPSEASIHDSSSQAPTSQESEAGEGAPYHRVGVEDVATSPTVVGRYDAGGSSYVLLSDGAIEVKTETGVHRFASMQDLKAFIEAQELQASGQDP